MAGLTGRDGVPSPRKNVRAEARPPTEDRHLFPAVSMSPPVPGLVYTYTSAQESTALPLFESADVDSARCVRRALGPAISPSPRRRHELPLASER